MKTLPFTFTLLLVTAHLAFGQDIRRLSRGTSEQIVTIQLGIEPVQLSSINQALAKAGYGSLAPNARVLRFSQETGPEKSRFRLLTSIGVALPGAGTSTEDSRSNRLNSFSYVLNLGAGYQLIRTSQWNLMPHINGELLNYQLRIYQDLSQQNPTLNAVLTNPGAMQQATLRTSAGALLFGLRGHYRYTYAQSDIECLRMKKSVVIGFDAGYRLSSRTASLTGVRDGAWANFSGWYAGIQIGFGLKTQAAAGK
ncbi:hypothetical protein [Arsenicibacter rosenii]|nr:hypothetical protein [Arsenicibacter rosenii]